MIFPLLSFALKEIKNKALKGVTIQLMSMSELLGNTNLDNGLRRRVYLIEKFIVFPLDLCKIEFNFQ